MLNLSLSSLNKEVNSGIASGSGDNTTSSSPPPPSINVTTSSSSPSSTSPILSNHNTIISSPISSPRSPSIGGGNNITNITGNDKQRKAGIQLDSDGCLIKRIIKEGYGEIP